ncbi:hypothetical protein B0O80DRAFT_429002 [Mortierella sp. GBAus27b]|nr:hypothetical protein B0O80DRAFT_429002 [Mortierella sp. GBAus27b]
MLGLRPRDQLRRLAGSSSLPSTVVTRFAEMGGAGDRRGQQHQGVEPSISSRFKTIMKECNKQGPPRVDYCNRYNIKGQVRHRRVRYHSNTTRNTQYPGERYSSTLVPFISILTIWWRSADRPEVFLDETVTPPSITRQQIGGLKRTMLFLNLTIDRFSSCSPHSFVARIMITRSMS